MNQSLFSGSQNEPLHFVKVTEKGTAEKDLTDPYCHFIRTSEKFLKGYYLKQCRSKQISKKKFQILSTPIVFAPDEVFDTYVDIMDDLDLDVQFFKLLIKKANTYMLIFFQLVIFSPGRLLNEMPDLFLR